MFAEFVVRQEFKLPSPVQILTGMWPLVLSGELEIDFTTSIMHYVSGMALAILVGIPLGALTGWFRVFDRALTPIIELFRPIPPIAWIPFAIAWLHLTDAAAAAIIFTGAVFPIWSIRTRGLGPSRGPSSKRRPCSGAGASST